MKWEKVTLEDICTVTGGTTPRTNIPEFWGGDIVWLSPVDLPEVGTITTVRNSQRKLTDLGLESSGLQLLPTGSLVFSTRASIGKIGIVDTPLVTNQGFTNFIPSNRVNVRYLAYALKKSIPEIETLGNTTTFKEVSRSAMRKYKVPLPPLHIQEQIADTLDKADALRRKDQELLQKYDELAQSIFYDMFGDPVQNDKRWMKCFLKDLVEVKGGKRLPIGSDFATTITDHPYIRVKDFENQSVKVSDLKYITAETHKHISRYVINTGDVYISIAGTIGLCGTVPDVLDGANLTENAAKLVIRDKNLLTPAYLSAFLMSPYGQGEITKRTMAVGVPKLALFRIEELEILLPPLEVQNNYVQRLMKLSDIKVHSQKSQEQTDVLFSSCLIGSFS